MKVAVSKDLSSEEKEHTHFCTVEGLFAFIQEIEAKEASGERMVMGWKGKFNYRPGNRMEREQAEQNIAQELVKSAQRRAKKNKNASDV